MLCKTFYWSQVGSINRRKGWVILGKVNPCFIYDVVVSV